MTAPRRPAMSDVAQVAGVSHQTVSRVVNDHPSVRPETRQRVQDAIAALGYRRNTAARSLVTRRTGTIGVLTSGSALFGPTSTLIAVEGAARRAGLFVSVATVVRWDADGVREVLEHFMSQGVDGVVVIATHDEAIGAVRSFTSPVPVVMVGPAELSGHRLHTVAVDQYAGARAATRHLLGLGHRHVVHLTGPRDWLDARSRERGWRDELAGAGIASGDPVRADWSADTGYALGCAMVGDGLPTAVFAANDQLALGLLHAFAERGVRVPGDVSVVGYDDVAGAAHFVPPLTTVRQGFRELGTRCLRLLLEVMDGGDPHADAVPPELVVRQSSGPPRDRSSDDRDTGLLLTPPV